MWFDLSSDREDPLEDRRVFWLEATEGWQLGNGTKYHSSVVFGDSFYQLNLHSPFSPQTHENAAEERRMFELTVPNLHQQHSLRPEGDEGCSLEGVGGTAGEPAPQRSGCACRASRSQGQFLYLLPLTRSDPKWGAATAETLVNEEVCSTVVWLWKIKKVVPWKAITEAVRSWNYRLIKGGNNLKKKHSQLPAQVMSAWHHHIPSLDCFRDLEINPKCTHQNSN